MTSLKEKLDKRRGLVASARKILDGATGGKLNTEQQAEYDRMDKEIDDLSVEIDAHNQHQARIDKLAKLDAPDPLPRQTAALPPGLRPQGGDGATLSFDFGRGGTVVLGPNHPAYDRAPDAYHRAFTRYLSGEQADFEKLGLKVGTDPQGGYLAPVAMVAGLIKFLDDNVFMRQLATVLPPTTAKSVGVLSYDTDPNDSDWTAEVPSSDISEDDAIRFGGREMSPSLITKLLKASRKLIRSSSIPLDGFLTGRLGYKFAITEERGFLTGSGANQALGVFVAHTHGISTGRDVTASSATNFTFDDVINTLMNLKEAYQMRATWLVSREFIKRCRKLKDGNGNYIWQPGTVGGQPGTILERPYRMSEYVPSTYTTGLYVAMCGDFSQYYIQDSLSLEIQRLDELFSLRNQVGWVARKETDGMPVLEEAFSRLKLGA